MKVKHYKNIDIQYVIDKRKIRNCYLKIIDGVVYVRVPKVCPNLIAEKLLNDNMEWVYIQLVNLEIKKEKNKIKEGSKVKIFGSKYTVSIENVDRFSRKCRKKLNVFIDDKNLCIENKKENVIDQDEIVKYINDYKKDLLQDKLNAIIPKVESATGYSAKTYRIRDIKSAWGTCSSTKNITLALQLVEFGDDVITYVVLHEICHLKYMNHSKDFWNMVEKYMPNYKIVRKKVKENIDI